MDWLGNRLDWSDCNLQVTQNIESADKKHETQTSNEV